MAQAPLEALELVFPLTLTVWLVPPRASCAPKVKVTGVCSQGCACTLQGQSWQTKAAGRARFREGGCGIVQVCQDVTSQAQLPYM